VRHPVPKGMAFQKLVSRYAADLTQDQKNSLLDVIRVTNHPKITPEIRRELVQAVARGEPRPPEDIAMEP
jgi:essential nuclear protein 1